ncbi:hypothetical protein [Elizabethkingia anophelis]|uniref:hypothetical protein n=1 Tax=Elizabethkingia anophelis TaxID=1117645 RepID=UPI0008402ACF|nr:hypothetical protein [Elizabethkingia anophelis]OCW75086.1 hypothetical protein A4G24_08425 [Elizabethkingia anophelis]
MKYVIFKKSGLYLPVTFPDHITHSQVTVNWHDKTEVHSAGFFKLNSIGLPEILSGFSESLNIGPAKNDLQILTYFYLNSGTAQFIDYENFDVDSSF